MHNLFPLLAQTSSQLTEQETAAVGAAALVVVLVALIISIIFVIPLFVIFKKAGFPAWAAIIPIYNIYIWTKMIGRSPVYVFGGIILLALLSAVPFVNFLTAPVAMIVGILMTYEQAIVFGQSPGFGIAHVLLTPFTNFYLAFSGNAQYQGPLYGADQRVLMESPWIDPALMGVGVNTYGGYTAQAPGNVGGYQPPAAPSQPPVPPQQPPAGGNGFGQSDSHGFGQSDSHGFGQ
ncbi:DUF5684 domain-containing protein [Stomatohabitans albus]|uniref:DUF5684 domain-containing protein n=1 Tax=Stomatohabitans albus TaxID=3110766 RepID=UPI00300C4A50